MRQDVFLDQFTPERAVADVPWRRVLTVVISSLVFLMFSLNAVLAHAPALATTSDQTPLLTAPDPDETAIETIPPETEVELTGATAIGFVGVSWNGSTGWVAATKLVVDDADGIPLTTAIADTALLAAPLRDADPLGAIPTGGVVMLTGASNGGYVAGSYGGIGGWILESDLELPYDADSGTGQ